MVQDSYECCPRLLKSFSIMLPQQRNFISQAMNPDCIIHTAVEGSKDEGVHLTAVARIREISLCNFHGLLSELPFPVFLL